MLLFTLFGNAAPPSFGAVGNGMAGLLRKMAVCLTSQFAVGFLLSKFRHFTKLVACRLDAGRYDLHHCECQRRVRASAMLSAAGSEAVSFDKQHCILDVGSCSNPQSPQPSSHMWHAGHGPHQFCKGVPVHGGPNIWCALLCQVMQVRCAAGCILRVQSSGPIITCLTCCGGMMQAPSPARC